MKSVQEEKLVPLMILVLASGKKLALVSDGTPQNNGIVWLTIRGEVSTLRESLKRELGRWEVWNAGKRKNTFVTTDVLSATTTKGYAGQVCFLLRFKEWLE